MQKIDYTRHNWLVFKIANQWLKTWSENIKGTVYDLGCGERPYEKFILEHADKYIGVDWSNTLHSLKADIVADLNKPLDMIENECADTVFSVSVMEHLSEPQNFLNEAFRILKPGGAMLLQVPFQWHVHEAPYDYFRYTRYGLKYMFSKAGFDSVDVTANTGFWSMFVLKLNYQTCRYIRGPKILKIIIRALLIIFWNIGQFISPVLDKLDRNENETAVYTVIARKSETQ